MTPFMKYPGGKSKEAPLVIKYMPKKIDRIRLLHTYSPVQYNFYPNPHLSAFV